MPKENLIGYCLSCASLDKNDVNKLYHDNEYGFPVLDDNELFARLVLEINQAGLSWTTILKKKVNFYTAFDEFNIKKVANYKEREIERLLSDAKIIRNKLKINAAIYNANQILSLQAEYGSFLAWLNVNHPKSRDEWVKLFKKKFKFVGGEIVNEFLMSIGFLEGAHCKDCPTLQKTIKKQAKWLKK